MKTRLPHRPMLIAIIVLAAPNVFADETQALAPHLAPDAQLREILHGDDDSLLSALRCRDLVEVAEVEGHVPDMNLVTTTIKTVDYQRLNLPNNNVWGNTIPNADAETARASTWCLALVQREHRRCSVASE